MEKLQTINQKNVTKFESRFRILLKIPDEMVHEVLKVLDYGRVVPDVWQDHREGEYNKKISKICNIDERAASSLIALIVSTIRRMRKKDFVSKRAADLKKLGFKQSEVDKFLRVTDLLKKNKAYDEISKVDKWIMMSSELLPRLSSIEYSFDIRCEIEKNRIGTSLPIILLKLELEDTRQKVPKEIVFQTDIGTFRHIVRNLAEIYRNAKVLRKYTLKVKD